MGVFELAGRVLTTYKADISDMKAKLKELSGAEKELMKARIESVEQGNRGLEDQVKGYQKVAVHLAAVAGAVLVAKKGYEEYSNYTRQATAAAGVDMKALSVAAGGLLSQMDLLTFAAKENHGAWKLNNGEMEDVLQAWRALRKEGADSEQALQDLTQAITENKTEALEKYGISVSKMTDGFEQHRAILSALRSEYQKFHGDLSLDTDEVDRFGVMWDDFTSSLKRGIGEGIVGVVDGLRSMREGLRGIADGLIGVSPEMRKAIEQQKEYVALMEHTVNAENAEINTMLVLKQLGALSGSDVSNLLKAEDDGLAAIKARGDAALKMADKMKNTAATLAVQLDRVTAEFRRAQAEGDDYNRSIRIDYAGLAKKANQALLKLDQGGLNIPSAPVIRDRFNDVTYAANFDFIGPDFLDNADSGDRSDFLESDIAMRNEEISNSAATRGQGWAERHFGKLSDFDAYANAFSALQDASTSALNAWISGSESLGDALKKAISTGLAATSVQLGIEALKHGAYAIGALAFGDIPGMAAHLQAAALFGVGAIAAGEAAHLLGGGGQTGAHASGGYGGGAGASAPLGNIGSGTDHRTPLGAGGNYLIMVNDEFAEDTPQRRSKRAYDALQTAKRRGGDGEGLRWS